MNAKKVFITGGLGFIGSNLIKRIEDTSKIQVVLADDFGVNDKWKNVASRGNICDFVSIDNEYDYLNKNVQDIGAIIHLGAISSTTEKNVDLLIENNYRRSIDLYNFCAQSKLPFIYASSASVYGNSGNFDDRDDIETISLLRPLNAYGWSKKLIDYHIAQNNGFIGTKHQCVGLRFFNVYGPNEYHKGKQASVFYHFFRQIEETGSIKLFKSTLSGLQDGEQKRDFVYVDDCCDVILWLLSNPQISGIFNVGTAEAYSFNMIANQITKELEIERKVQYIDMPQELVKHYQNFTQSNSTKLIKAGYDKKFTTLTEGIHRYYNILKSKEIYI